MDIGKTWKPLAGVALAVGAALTLALAAIQPASAQGEGNVRIMHASPDTPAVDIFVDGQPAVEGLAFPNDTGYVALPAGTYNVEVFVSPSDGTGEPALQADLEVAEGSFTTVLATGLLEDGSLGLLPLADDLSTPEAGNAHVRLVHASPDAPAVDVLADGAVEVFTNVSFNEAQGPNPVPAGTYDISVRVSPDGDTVLEIPGVALADQGIYTAVAVGLAGDGTLAVQLLVDAAAPNGPPPTGTGFASQDGGMSTAWLAIAGALLLATGAGGMVALRNRR